MARLSPHDSDVLHMTAAHIRHIVICGSGLAAWMTAATMSKNLPAAIQVTVLETTNSDAADIFYGSVTNPNSYKFFLNLGLSEADLLLRTQSSFSYGTSYKNWGLTDVSWIQSFQAPFPIWDGAPFAHHITDATPPLEQYLMSAQAAAKGKFVHPPADKNSPLSSTEYGYHYTARDLTKLLKVIAEKQGVQSKFQDIAAIESHDRKITGLKLKEGETLSAELYVDASGPEAPLISALEDADIQTNRSLSALYSEQKNENLGPPLRQVISHDFGWQSLTPLQNDDAVLTVYTPQSEQAARKVHPQGVTAQCSVSLGRRIKAWSGNCVAIGHAAAIVEPTSPAPLMLLQMDIERLMGLIPVTDDFEIEAKVFNEAFQKDVENIELFNSAFFQLEGVVETEYWSAAKSNSSSARLNRKLEQFANRGLLVSYDLEPFNDEDWTILHHGTGRTPRKRDAIAKLSDVDKIDRDLKNKAKAIQTIVAKMPPHHIYLAKFLNYLERNHVSDL